MIRVPIRNFIPVEPPTLRSGHGRKSLSEIGDIKASLARIVDRPQVSGITLDKKESPDLDDGVSVVKKQNGNYVLQVSISDISEIIPPYSNTEKRALGKSTSIYFRTHILHMFPEVIATDIASLNHREKRPALTIEIELGRDFKVIRSDIYESIFFNEQRYDYEGFSKDFLNRGSHRHTQLHLMHELALGLSRSRGQREIRDFDESDRHIHIGATSPIFHSKHVASFITAEFMKLANIEAAKMCVREEIDGVFRVHMSEMDGSDIKPDVISPARYMGEAGFHYGLGVKKYAHFTSPIRRFADYILHRQIKWFLKHREGFYSKEDITELCEYINSQVQALMIAQKLDHQEVMSKILLRKSKKKNGGSIALADIIHVVKVILSKDAQLPQIVKELLIETINSCARIDDTLLGLILKTQDADLLTFLKDKVLEDKKVVRYINILKSQGLIDYEEHVSEEEGMFIGEDDVTIELTFCIKGQKKQSMKISNPKDTGRPIILQSTTGVTDTELREMLEEFDKQTVKPNNARFHSFNIFAMRKTALYMILTDFISKAKNLTLL